MMNQLQYARQIAAQNNDIIRDKYVHQHDKNIQPVAFHLNQKVLLDENQFLNKNRKLAAKYNGRYLITKLMQTNAEIQGKNNRKFIVHLNRLKPYRHRTESPDNSPEPHILDLYKNSTATAQPSESLIAQPPSDIRDISPPPKRGRGRPRKIVNNLFEHRRDGTQNSNLISNTNSNLVPNLDLSHERSVTNDAFNEINDNRHETKNTNDFVDKRITRSTFQTMPPESKENYFQSLNLLQSENNEIYTQKIFTIITKKKKLKTKRKNGTKNVRDVWTRAQHKNFIYNGDIFGCVAHSLEPVMDGANQLPDAQGGS